jgi:hypothetical protein
MKRSALILSVVAVLTACDKETRNGQLDLNGSAPVRIADQNGGTVEFYTGPLKVEFSADSSRKVSVQLEQSGRSAKFTAKVPRNAGWNFSVKGSEIGQPVDLASARTIELYGPVEIRTGHGAPCGMNGNYLTEEKWQLGNEDWAVTFADAQSAQSLAQFKSRREGQEFLLETRNLWCRERHHGGPGGRWDRHASRGRWNDLSTKLDALQQTGLSW